jgi:hypothetical protein
LFFFLCLFVHHPFLFTFFFVFFVFVFLLCFCAHSHTCRTGSFKGSNEDSSPPAARVVHTRKRTLAKHGSEAKQAQQAADAPPCQAQSAAAMSADKGAPAMAASEVTRRTMSALRGECAVDSRAKAPPPDHDGFLVQTYEYVRKRLPTLNEFCVICDQQHALAANLMVTTCEKRSRFLCNLILASLLFPSCRKIIMAC